MREILEAVDHIHARCLPGGGLGLWKLGLGDIFGGLLKHVPYTRMLPNIHSLFSSPDPKALVLSS